MIFPIFLKFLDTLFFFHIFLEPIFTPWYAPNGSGYEIQNLTNPILFPISGACQRDVQRKEKYLFLKDMKFFLSLGLLYFLIRPK